MVFTTWFRADAALMPASSTDGERVMTALPMDWEQRRSMDGAHEARSPSWLEERSERGGFEAERGDFGDIFGKGDEVSLNPQPLPPAFGERMENPVFHEGPQLTPWGQEFDVEKGDKYGGSKSPSPDMFELPRFTDEEQGRFEPGDFELPDGDVIQIPESGGCFPSLPRCEDFEFGGGDCASDSFTQPQIDPVFSTC
jgi:hypothetical protein